MIVRGPERVAHLRARDRDLRDALRRRRRTSRSGCPVYGRSGGSTAGIHAVLTARRLACAPWGSRAWLDRARPLAPARSTSRSRHPAGSWSYAELLAAARSRAAAAAGPRARRRGERVAIALPPGARRSRRRCTRACCSGAVAVPVDLRLCRAERERIADGAAVLVEEPLGDGTRPRGRSGALRARPRRDRCRDPHLRHDRRAASRSS